MIDYKLVKCPKCGKMHFKATGQSGEGSYFDFLTGMTINDCLFRKGPDRIYLNGELENPEAFVPSPTKTYFECMECGCHFSVKTTYHLNGAETYETIDEDKAREETELAWKKAQEEREKEEKKRKAVEKRKATLAKKKWEAEHPDEKYEDHFATVKVQDVDNTITLSGYPIPSNNRYITSGDMGPSITTYMGSGDKSEIDLGEFKLKSNKKYNKFQKWMIKKFFGFEVKNND